MKAAEAAAGHRLVDYLDLHWYPEAQGGGVRITDDGTVARRVAARVQAPRSLWDTTYKETSWIVDDVLGEPIHLISRIGDEIAAHYPGTGLAITEWNYGGGQDISGRGRRGRRAGHLRPRRRGHGSYWALNGDESFANAAFRAYRDYDGNGRRLRRHVDPRRPPATSPPPPSTPASTPPTRRGWWWCSSTGARR